MRIFPPPLNSRENGREGAEEERDRNINMREIQRLVISYMYPYQGWGICNRSKYL